MTLTREEYSINQSAVDNAEVMAINEFSRKVVIATYTPPKPPYGAKASPEVIKMLATDEAGLSFKLIKKESLEKDELSLSEIVEMSPGGLNGKIQIHGSWDMAKDIKAVIMLSKLCPDESLHDLMTIAKKEPSVVNMSKSKIESLMLSSVEKPEIKNKDIESPSFKM